MSSNFSAQTAATRYLALMHEFVERSDLVSAAISGKFALSFPYLREFTYLQFRYMCEIMAVGCLILNKNIAGLQSQAGNREWNAGKIMRLLHQHHTYAFPQCAQRETSKSGAELINANCNPNSLTYAEFNMLYAECGEVLHRGSTRSIEQSQKFTSETKQQITVWQSKLIDLMNIHIVGRTNERGFYLTTMRTLSGYPVCDIFTRQGDGGVEINRVTMNPINRSDTDSMLIGNMKPYLHTPDE